MAKKRAKKVEAVQEQKTTRPVRLDLIQSDYERLDRISRELGLNKSSYCRMVVLKALKQYEEQH